MADKTVDKTAAELPGLVRERYPEIVDALAQADAKGTLDALDALWASTKGDCDTAINELRGAGTLLGFLRRLGPGCDTGVAGRLLKEMSVSIIGSLLRLGLDVQSVMAGACDALKAEMSLSEDDSRRD